MHFSARNFLAPYLHQFFTVVQNCIKFGAIWDKFALYLVLIYHQNLKIYAKTKPSNGAIWDEFSDQH